MMSKMDKKGKREHKDFVDSSNRADYGAPAGSFEYGKDVRNDYDLSGYCSNSRADKKFGVGISADVGLLPDYNMLSVVDQIKKFREYEEDVDVVSVSLPRQLADRVSESMERDDDRLQYSDIGHISLFLGYIEKKEKPLIVRDVKKYEETVRSLRDSMIDKRFSKLYQLCHVIDEDTVKETLSKYGFEVS